jgi:Fe2+ transport system protein B
MTGHLWADALMGVAIALLLMWLLLAIALAVGRPKSKLLSESIRLLAGPVTAAAPPGR